MSGRTKPDLYFSCDIEADGPIPGPYSMSSFGLCVAGRYDGTTFERIDPDQHTFYRELRPISEKFDPEAAAVSALDRDELIRSGADPATAMHECAEWVRATATDYKAKAIFAAYPLGFDFSFMHWYFVAFNEGADPFGFSWAVDMKSLFSAKSGNPISASTKRMMPEHLLGTREHTHNALDDAKGQADLLQNLMGWDGRS